MITHSSFENGYHHLVDRLNRFPQGAPPSRTLYRILELLFSEKEAELVSLLPIKPFTAENAARIWKMNPGDVQNILDDLADRAVLVDIEQNGKMVYCLPPPMAGFFEFSLMRTRGDIDQRLLSELFYRYINEEEDFVKALFLEGDTKIGRIFAQEAALSDEQGPEVMDYERASEVIQTATHIGISLCYCRHKMEHLGRSCDAPKEICMTFNAVAASLIRHGFARQVSQGECLDLLQAAWGNNLVQFGENVREGVNFICNCCRCCCEAMIAVRRLGLSQSIRSDFQPRVHTDRCTGCAKCEAACPVDAIAVVISDAPRASNGSVARVDETVCLGCGICSRVCPSGAISLHPRKKRRITPLDTAQRTVMMATEKGTLPHLIFDNQVLFSHRALAAVLGAILKLSPVQQLMAKRQLQSRFLDYLTARLNSHRLASDES